MTFLITGCSRGIGLELTKQALALGHKVYAAVREPNKAADLKSLQTSYSSHLRIISLDASSDASVANATKEVNESIDVLINNAGVYLDSQANSLSELQIKMVEDTLQTNTLGPMRVTKALLPQLSRNQSAKVINITSLMGSIEDNAGGGSYGYRMSKTALNMFSKCLSIEFPKITVLSVHPGWVQTDMGGKGATTSIPESAKGILNLIEKSSSDDSGKFYDFRSRELPW